jgi:hypothetical protein
MAGDFVCGMATPWLRPVEPLFSRAMIALAKESRMSADTLPAGATFDPAAHGHWSRQDGPLPLQTLFVKDPAS